MYWYFFPRELRDMILKVVAKDEPNIFRYASVCREWRQATESTAFRQIYITPPYLPELVELAYTKRAFLQCIRFHISLYWYDCTHCDKEVESSWHEADNKVVSAALRNLFDALSTWEASDQNLTLDITISSPSDAEHHFQNCHFGEKNLTKTLLPDDPYHGWSMGRQVKYPPWQSLMRVFSMINLDLEYNSLPEVKAITGLQIRRQSNRQIAPFELGDILRRLPMLQSICYEPWRQWTRWGQRWNDIYYSTLLQFRGMRHLERLIIFEDYNDDYIKIDSQPWEDFDPPEPLRAANPFVSRSIVEASLKWETLSVSFLADAWNFFFARKPGWTWNKLTSLTLTCRTLSPDDDNSCKKINFLLQAAADFAMNCPKLELLTLWNYDGSNTCAFIYQAFRAEERATITWRATWSTMLRPVTVELWEDVALKFAKSELSIIHEELDASIALRSRGHAIQHLKLPSDIIHEQSLSQILEEAKYQSIQDGLDELFI